MIYMPICICSVNLAYQAIVKISGKTVREDNHTLHIRGGRPSIVEDISIENSKLNIDALNKRAAEIGRAASRHNSMIIATTLGQADRM